MILVVMVIQLWHGTGGIRLLVEPFWLGTGGWRLVLGTTSIGLNDGRSGIGRGCSHRGSTTL